MLLLILLASAVAPFPNFVPHVITDDMWNKHIIDDGGIAAQRCEAVDVDGDGDLDLIASGGSTHNVKWYENRTR